MENFVSILLFVKHTPIKKSKKNVKIYFKMLVFTVFGHLLLVLSLHHVPFRLLQLGLVPYQFRLHLLQHWVRSLQQMHLFANVFPIPPPPLYIVHFGAFVSRPEFGVLIFDACLLRLKIRVLASNFSDFLRCRVKLKMYKLI